MAGEAFARDLGYLDAFFDKLEAHAATLGAAEGARLKILMTEERARWAEIRGLVAGGKVSTGGSRPIEAPPPAPRGADHAPTRSQTALTVGSLIGR